MVKGIIINNATKADQYKDVNIWNYSSINSIDVPGNTTTSKQLLLDYLLYLDISRKLEFLKGSYRLFKSNGLIRDLVDDTMADRVLYRGFLDNLLDRLMQPNKLTDSLYVILNLYPVHPPANRSIFNSIPRGAGPEAAWMFPLHAPLKKAYGHVTDLYDIGCIGANNNPSQLNNLVDILPSFIALSCHLLQEVPRKYNFRNETLQTQLHDQSISFNTYQSLLDDLNNDFIIHHSMSQYFPNYPF